MNNRQTSTVDGKKGSVFPFSRGIKLFIFFILLIGMAGVIFIYSSILGIGELVYPVKVDSAYVAARQLNFLKHKKPTDTIPSDMFLYKPEQLELNYETILFQTTDSIILKGWYFKPKTECRGITILIIHDLNESKLSYLVAAKAFTERGFDVCCVDMRACGESGGSYFTFGTLISKDISIIMDSLFCRPEIDEIAMFGIGTGAAIAILAASYDQRAAVLIVENCFVNLNVYFSRYATHKWGILGTWFFPQMKKELNNQMGFHSDSLNLQEIIMRVSKPMLFVAKAKERIEDLKETHLLFECSPAERKEFIFFRESTGSENLLEQEKAYYDKISAFISTSVPKKEKKTKFKKLVLNDHQVNDR